MQKKNVGEPLTEEKEGCCPMTSIKVFKIIDVRSAVEMLKNTNWSWKLFEGLGYRLTEDDETEKALKMTILQIIDSCFPVFKEEK